jgi:putative oxidoreductase
LFNSVEEDFMPAYRALRVPILDNRASLGILLFRLFTGVALMVHGFPKVQHPFSWMGASGAVPSIFQACSALAEFGGGLALILGLLTPIACIGIIINMATAIFMVHLPHGDHWIGGGKTFEPALSYLISALMLLFVGPGRYSLDHKIFNRRFESNVSSIERQRAVSADIR